MREMQDEEGGSSVEFSREEFGEDRALSADPRKFTFCQPLSGAFFFETAAFGDDYLIDYLFVGAQNIFPCTIRTSDFPEMRIPIDAHVPCGMTITFAVRATKNNQTFDVRLLGKGRATPRVSSPSRPRVLSILDQHISACEIGGDPIRPNTTKEIRVYPQMAIMGDMLALDPEAESGLVLERAEVGRKPTGDKLPLRLKRHNTIRFPMAFAGQEIRFFVKNTNKEATLFRGRLYGKNHA